MVRILEKEEGSSFELLYDIPHNDNFIVTSIISNKKKTRIKGTVRVVWERQFNVEGNSYFPSEKRENSSDDVEWFYVIGEKYIDIPADARFWKSNITCKVLVAYKRPKFWPIGWIHLYWKGENDKDWTLVRLDTDNLFNNNYNGYVFDSVTNTIGVLLDNW